MDFRGLGLGFRAEGLEVWGLGFRALGLRAWEFGAWRVGFEGLGLVVLGFRA